VINQDPLENSFGVFKFFASLYSTPTSFELLNGEKFINSAIYKLKCNFFEIFRNEDCAAAQPVNWKP
jgi:hypothetical protein